MRIWLTRQHCAVRTFGVDVYWKSKRNLKPVKNSGNTNTVVAVPLPANAPAYQYSSTVKGLPHLPEEFGTIPAGECFSPP